MVVLSASYQCVMMDTSRKPGTCPPVPLEIAEKVLNNTVGEMKMMRYGNASYETAVDLM